MLKVQAGTGLTGTTQARLDCQLCHRPVRTVAEGVIVYRGPLMGRGAELAFVIHDSPACRDSENLKYLIVGEHRVQPLGTYLADLLVALGVVTAPGKEP
jgi:hypothetical protein